MSVETQIEFEQKSKILLQHLNSKEELQNWMYIFFGIWFPSGTVYPTSTHGPVEAMWRIYELIKTGESEYIPQVAMLASRDSFKTLGAAAIQTLCMIHFRFSLAHMAAISSQSDKAVQYINSFFRKLKPYLESNGWKNHTDSKKMISWLTEEGQEVYIKVVIATISGANCIDPDSIVETKNGKIKASEVSPGDYLKTYNLFKDNEQYVKVTTTGTLLSETREFIFEDGSNLISSIKHKIFTKRGWINASNLRIGDSIIATDHYHTNIKKSLTSQLFKNSLESMVYGTLLGKANILKLPNGHCCYELYNNRNKLQYLEQIQKIFQDNGIDVNIVSDKNRYRLYTKTHDLFEKVYNILYTNDIKVINDKWLKFIDFEALSFLIMDNGIGNSIQVGKSKEDGIDIRFSDCKCENIGLLIDKIKKMGFYCVDKSIDKYCQIHIPLEDSRELTYEISKYFVDSLKYKLCFSDDIRFFIDSGNINDRKDSCNSNIFDWENNKKIHNFENQIISKLNKKITKIRHLGIQRLFGIGIDPISDFNLRSFYANGILVHNSEHVPMLCIDEVDVIQDPRALQEAKMIPSTFGKYFPLTVYLSTRKFAGGLMEKILRQTIEAGGEVLRWNIIDVTERISHEEARVDEPKIVRYISRDLPMESLTEEQFIIIPEEKKHKYERLEAYAGIADHPLLPVMKNYLVDRPQDHIGGLYKKISATLNNFKQLDSEMAEAQLLCNKPSSSGLVYPRFDDDNNVMSVQEAWEKISGNDSPCDFQYLKQYILDLGIPIIGGGDWGFTDYTVLTVLALLPREEVLLLDTFALPGLELDDIVKYGKELQDGWNVKKWYVDQAYPSYIKTLRRKAGMICPKFNKDVSAGISSLQKQIVTSTNIRKFFILDTPNNKTMIEAFGSYRWSIDGKGEVIEGKPYHDKEGVSDHMDSIRYPFQNLFSKSGKVTFTMAGDPNQDKKKQLISNSSSLNKTIQQVNHDIMAQKIKSLATNDDILVTKTSKKRKILW